MTDAPKQPHPDLLAAIAADVEGGRLADAATLLAQLEAEGYGGEALAALKDRLARGQFAEALGGQIRAMVAQGLPAPPAAPNRAQRRAQARGGRARQPGTRRR
jgi:hypothetical protein